MEKISLMKYDLMKYEDFYKSKNSAICFLIIVSFNHHHQSFTFAFLLQTQFDLYPPV